MSKLRTLLSLEFRSLYGINKHRHTKDRKAKRRYRTVCLVLVLLVVMVFGYVGGLAYGLCALGMADIVPAYLVVIASALILAVGLFQAGHRIFAPKGYDILASMPLRSGALVLSRFLAMYVEELAFSLAIMLPGTVVYGLCCRPAAGFYLAAAVGTLAIPAIPLVISTLFGTLIMAATSRLKNKSLMQAVLMVALVVAVMAGSFRLDSAMAGFDPQQLAQLARLIGSRLEQIYPPAMWLGEAVTRGSAGDLALFVLVSAAVIALAVLVASGLFHAVMRRLQRSPAKHNYKLGAMGRRSLLRALWAREAKRYFASGVYVSNTIVGPVLGAVLSVALCVVGTDRLRAALPFEIDLPGILPFLFAAVFCMMPVTSVSISMEGRQFWAIKALPIPAKTLLDGKMLLNLSLILPFYLVSAVAAILAVELEPLQLVWLLLIPATLILFTVVLGVTINLKSHSFDWEKEAEVVKQSLPAMLGGFVGLAAAVLFGGAVFLAPARYGDGARLAGCLIFWLATLLLYRKNSRTDLSKL